jgi:hypothetical protein
MLTTQASVGSPSPTGGDAWKNSSYDRAHQTKTWPSAQPTATSVPSGLMETVVGSPRVGMVRVDFTLYMGSGVIVRDVTTLHFFSSRGSFCMRRAGCRHQQCSIRLRKIIFRKFPNIGRDRHACKFPRPLSLTPRRFSFFIYRRCAHDAANLAARLADGHLNALRQALTPKTLLVPSEGKKDSLSHLSPITLVAP